MALLLQLWSGLNDPRHQCHSRGPNAIALGVTELFEVDFSGRVLPFDSRAALMFGANIATVRQRFGKPAVKDMDGMIAAIAISHDRCPVATRDRRPFELMGVEVISAGWT